MLDSVVAHLNLGDLLLSLAESQPDRTRARPLFVRAVDEYNRVLKLQPGQIEAVNNKAWVLHMYLERSQEALEVMKEVLKHADPSRFCLASSSTRSGTSRRRWVAPMTRNSLISRDSRRLRNTRC